VEKVKFLEKLGLSSIIYLFANFGYFCNLKKSAQSEQSHNSRKFVQSGHPAANGHQNPHVATKKYHLKGRVNKTRLPFFKFATLGFLRARDLWAWDLI
jgi:hypothetical protein